MNVADKVFVAIDYRLSLESGQEVDRSPEGQPLGFITGAGQIIPGLESGLMGKAAGESLRVTVEPDDAYGPVNRNLFQTIPRSRFPGDAEIVPGSVFQANGPRGPVAITVTKVNDDETVTIDLNHPMAGKRLFFDVTIVEVRDPSAAELMRLAAAAGGGCGCGSEKQAACGPGCNCG